MRQKLQFQVYRSIGKSLLNIIRKLKKFEIILLTANNNYKLIKQSEEFKVKNIILTDEKIYFKKIVKKQKY